MKTAAARRLDEPCTAQPGTGRLVAGVARDPVRAAVLAQVLRALGHPLRLRILAHLLGAGERTVNDIAAALGLPQAVASQHLGSLRLYGLLRVRRDGGFRRYSVALPMVAELVACMARCYRIHGSRLPQNTA